MKHILTISLCFLALSLSAQEAQEQVITYHYNPDSDEDSYIATSDMLETLAVFESELFTAEIQNENELRAIFGRYGIWLSVAIVAGVGHFVVNGPYGYWDFSFIYSFVIGGSIAAIGTICFLGELIRYGLEKSKPNKLKKKEYRKAKREAKRAAKLAVG